MCYTRIILNNYEKMTNGGKVKNVRYILYIDMYTIHYYYEYYICIYIHNVYRSILRDSKLLSL